MSTTVIIGFTIMLVLLFAVSLAAVMLYLRWRQVEEEVRELSTQMNTNARDVGRAEQLINQCDQLTDELLSVRTDHTEQIKQLTEQSDTKLQKANNVIANQQVRIAELETELDNERKSASEKLEFFNKAKSDMEAHFKNMAQEVLEEKSKKFAADSQKNLTPLITPLKDNIDSFRRKIEELHTENTRERTALKTHIEHLQKNASEMSSEADKLTKALKGSGKVQGDWGEQALQRLLENSGLTEGENYKTQQTHKTAEGAQRRPDVIIYLPENKNIIIDSKVSLTAYVDYTSATDEATRRDALARHLASVNAHVKRLADTDYSSITSLQSPDFVLMFMPLEPAYMLALQEDHHLFNNAYNKKVILISQTTLMPVLRTIANIWRVEKQQQYAHAIAVQGGKLYDKFVGFHTDMEKLGEQLQRAQKSYDNASNKMSNGQGNIISQAQKLRDMGVQVKKELPAAALELAE